MKEVLIKYFESKQLISIYADRDDTDKFMTGYINAISDDAIVINHISPRGQYDGYIYVELLDIYRVEINTNYIKKIEKLMKIMLKQNHKVLVTDKEVDLLHNYLLFMKENSFLISITIGDDKFTSVIGLVTKVDKELLYVKQISDEGVYDGETIISICEISSCQGDTCDEELIKVLMDSE